MNFIKVHDEDGLKVYLNLDLVSSAYVLDQTDNGTGKPIYEVILRVGKEEIYIEGAYESRKTAEYALAKLLDPAD